LTVTATVVEWLTVPDVPVTVRVPAIGVDPDPGLGTPEQPAKTISNTNTVANPSRARVPFPFTSRKVNIDATIRSAISLIKFCIVPEGGRGISKAVLVLVTVTVTGCAVVPSAAVIGEAIVQVVPAGAPVHTNVTL
jgi:hypothetical protein